jgi:thioesterase domain-containing protein
MPKDPGVVDARRVLLPTDQEGEISSTQRTECSSDSTNPAYEEQLSGVFQLQAGSQLPFFFLHGDWTGNAFFCFQLAAALGSDQPFYALDTYNLAQYPILPSLETIAAEQIALVRKIQPEGPYHLGGFCNGGLIVYEMARQLRTAGQEVRLLVLIDAIPTRCVKIRNVIAGMGTLLHLSQQKQLALYLRLQHLFRYLTDKYTEDYAHIKTFDARIASWFPPLETLRHEYPAMFYWATALYKPTCYPGKVTLFWDEAEPVRRAWWRKMAEGKDAEVDVHIIAGSHKTCKTEGDMGKQLRNCFDQLRLSPQVAH